MKIALLAGWLVAMGLMGNVAEAGTMFALTSQNVVFTLSPNGALDAAPVWTATGSGVLNVQPNGLAATLVTAGAGTNVVTVSATSGSLVLSNSVTVVVVMPPATTLGLATSLVAKP